MAERSKVFRATTEPDRHLIHIDGAFDSLPQRIRSLGPWQGAHSGCVRDLRPHYRAMLAEQRFVIVFGRQDLVRIELRDGRQAGGGAGS